MKRARRLTVGLHDEEGAGYVDPASADPFPVLRGHGLASVMLLASLLVYLAVGVVKFIFPGQQAAAPSLAYLLLLMMVVCWGVSGAAFFLDLYRIPVLIPLALLWTFTSQVLPSDHYYVVFDGSRPTIPPAELIRKGTERVLVIGTAGGGIQAAAWTAKVIEGIEQKVPRVPKRGLLGRPKAFREVYPAHQLSVRRKHRGHVRSQRVRSEWRAAEQSWDCIR